MSWAVRFGDAAKAFIELAMSVLAIFTELGRQLFTALDDFVDGLVKKTE